MPIPAQLRNYLITWPPQDDTDQKSYFETTHRVVSPEETLQRIIPLKERAGITRVSDITGLDCVGIPTYNAVRPVVDLYEDNITVYNGKGFTKIQAKVSALMEAFERYSAERHKWPVILETLDAMARNGAAVDPRRLILATGETYESHERLDWVCGRDLISGEVRFVPAGAVFCPYRSKNGGRSFKGFSNTNGLASGNSVSEAISHALAEVIERDARAVATSHRRGRSIDLSTINSPLVQSLIEKYRRANINIYIREITTELGIPSFSAAIDDPITENPILLNAGFGTHVNSEIALIRAVTEAAQSRCTFISGARDDIPTLAHMEETKKTGYRAMKRRLKFWYQDDLFPKNFRNIPTWTNQKITDDIVVMLTAFKKNYFREVIVVDLTRPELKIPVVRVIVPGLEHSLECGRRGPRTHGRLGRLVARLERIASSPA